MKIFQLFGSTVAITATLTGCSNLDIKADELKKSVTKDIKTHTDKSAQPVPVITNTKRAWLLGNQVKIQEPKAPILNTNIGYHPTRPVTLADAVAYITQMTGMVVDIAELQLGNGMNGSGNSQSGMNPMSAMTGMTGMTGMGGAMGGMGNMGGMNGMNMMPLQQSMFTMFLNYNGKLDGFLDVLANKSSAWWKIVDNNKIVFYRQETKTYYLPTMPRKYEGTSTIAANSGANQSSSTNSSSGSVSTSGASSKSTYEVDFWKDIESTGKIVSNGAQVAVNQAAGSITVTGTPNQLRHVEDWVKELQDQLSQQIAITMHVYSVKVTNEDNYGWNPSVVFKNVAGTYGFNLSGPQLPMISSGTNPSQLDLNVLSSPDPTKSSQYSGSQLAFQALTRLGNVTESISQTVVTLNGQPAPVQIANTKGYLASSSTTNTVNVGTTASLEQGTLTTGFTATFIPRILNGKIILGMTMENSSDNGFATVESGGAKIMTPNVDSNSNNQSISLTPGDALLLTGLQRDSGATNKNGVGKANNYVLGGGFGNNLSKQMIAIVITAKIL